ncbi:adenylate kinase [Streptomyces tsukubensis]|uniref:Adenylate kinase n=1 Tax=Streptomyces tsukubensis TaxID=83656 RepID=A0A1V4A9H3_9ACTN|nr:adenylate kinase [Streptomyces tsukubensis]OON79160.1 adenylate kinase [Streptomyces tsukubensis]QFR94729.1 adenylate kinase [Streptomyces tsukubensis]
MKRILVVGSSGAGKSTLARSLSATLALPYQEMDSLHFDGPGWRVSPTFRTDVERLAASPSWIVDSYGQPAVRESLWTRADTVVWLDYPRWVVMHRVLRRSLRRTLTRARVFGGNRERLREWFSRHHPAWSSWRGHRSRARVIQELTQDARFAPLDVVRLRSPAETAEWLRRCAGEVGSDER